MRPIAAIGFILLSLGTAATLIRPENRLSTYVPLGTGGDRAAPLVRQVMARFFSGR